MTDINYKEFNYAGVLIANGDIIFKNNSHGLNKIILISFNNSSAFNIELKKFDIKTRLEITIYKYELDAGDQIFDNTNYFLAPGEYLKVITASTSTNYSIQGQKL